MVRNDVATALGALVLLVLVFGCGEGQNPIQQYGEEVLKAKGRVERARAQANIKALETAIQQYYVDNGRFPASLSDLPIVQRQGIDVSLYTYDPATGNIQLL
jgi:competence protein ComGC